MIRIKGSKRKINRSIRGIKDSTWPIGGGTRGKSGMRVFKVPLLQKVRNIWDR